MQENMQSIERTLYETFHEKLHKVKIFFFLSTHVDEIKLNT